MVERFFVRSRTIRRLRDGPLGEYIDRFADRLWERGYARATARTKLWLVTDLSWWLQREQLTVDALNEHSVERFLNEGKRLGLGRHLTHDRAGLRELLGLLRELGEIPTPSPPSQESSRERLERGFKRYLVRERRLADSTLKNILPPVRAFLAQRFGTHPPVLGELSPSDVTRFVLRRVEMLSQSRAGLMTYALRSFFRFLRLRGDLAIDLSTCIPKVAARPFSTLPKSLDAEEVESLLSSCDQTTVCGQRDFTILLLLARLGLRAGEIVAMTLEDIDWDAGELRVRGKGGREDRLPLPRDVGEALAQYLSHGRPKCTTRRVFVRVRAPRRGFTSSVAICDVVRKALARAAIDSPRKGAHLLRHSLATEMLRKGASLDEIGQILRHRLADTTAIYARVDLAALRGLARPWPEGGEV